MSRLTFPEDFRWGCATASYQIEGSPLADGAGESIWHRFSHTPGAIDNGDTGDVACDHYRLYKDDVAIMKRLGLNSYRFSISWSRIFPQGKGSINQRGLDFYSGLIDELLAAGIKPCPTLYHWDYPQALQDLGGWQNPDAPLWFRDYAATLFDSLGDRVKFWITMNEPIVVAFSGYGIGEHPPGIADMGASLDVAHNLLKAHGLAVQAFRETDCGGEIGITINLEYSMPATDSSADRAAAQRYHAFANEWFLDPIFLGKYPDEMIKATPRLAEVSPKDAEIISQPIDFWGMNNYKRSVWKHEDSAFLQVEQVFVEGKYTGMNWEVYPDGIYQLLKWVDEKYNKPVLYITENGAVFPDKVESDGSVNDEDRVDFLREYLKACHRAIQEGVDLRGYFLWTLMDNFEWMYGFDKRFGIVRTDFDTQKRTIKKSGHWYSETIKNNGFSD
jgi:beta-glucosidase